MFYDNDWCFFANNKILDIIRFQVLTFCNINMAAIIYLSGSTKERPVYWYFGHITDSTSLNTIYYSQIT